MIDIFSIYKSREIIPPLSAEPAMASQSSVSSLSLKTITVRVRRQNSEVETVALGKPHHSLLLLSVWNIIIIHRPRVQEIPAGQFPCLERRDGHHGLHLRPEGSAGNWRIPWGRQEDGGVPGGETGQDVSPAERGDDQAERLDYSGLWDVCWAQSHRDAAESFLLRALLSRQQLCGESVGERCQGGSGSRVQQEEQWQSSLSWGEKNLTEPAVASAKTRSSTWFFVSLYLYLFPWRGRLILFYI